MSKQMRTAGEHIVGAWKQVKREVHRKWSKLTKIDVEHIQGERAVLAARIQQRYGIANEEANLQIDKWAEGRNISPSPARPGQHTLSASGYILNVQRSLYE